MPEDTTTSEDLPWSDPGTDDRLIAEYEKALEEAEAIQREANPTVQTLDKSAGLVDGKLPEYPDDSDYVSSQIALVRESTPEASVRVGDGPDAGQVVSPVSNAPSIVQGAKDYVPADRHQPPMSLEEQIKRGIGNPNPNVPTFITE